MEFEAHILQFRSTHQYYRTAKYQLNRSTRHEDIEILIFGPDFWRPLIHVKDVSDACIRCIESSSDLVSGEIYNVGASEQNFTKLELAQIVQEYFPDIQIEIQKSKKDPRNYKVSFDKIRKTFDFKIKNTVRDGISEMVDGINNGTLNYTNSDFSSRAKLAEKIPIF